MKNIRFYLEHDTPQDKRNNKHNGNVMAVLVGNHHYQVGGWMEECISAVYFEENSPVAGSSASVEYLRKNCKRISEKKAREIHPRLFEVLDKED